MAESRCRWGRPTRIDFNEVGPYLAPGLIHTTDGTPCGGAECKDRRSYPWEYRKQRLGKIVLLANEPERRAPGQITDRRVAKGERRQGKELRKYDGTGFKHRDSGHSLGGRWNSNRRSGQDRRQPKAAPADPRGPLRHDTDSGSCECGAWHEKDKPAEGIVERLIRHLPQCDHACEKCGPWRRDALQALRQQRLDIERQAAEIQRLEGELANYRAHPAPWEKYGVVDMAERLRKGHIICANLERENQRLREALERIRDEGHGDGWAEIARAPMLLADIAKKALTPKEPNGADQEAE